MFSLTLQVFSHPSCGDGAELHQSCHALEFLMCRNGGPGYISVTSHTSATCLCPVRLRIQQKISPRPRLHTTCLEKWSVRRSVTSVCCCRVHSSNPVHAAQYPDNCSGSQQCERDYDCSCSWYTWLLSELRLHPHTLATQCQPAFASG